MKREKSCGAIIIKDNKVLIIRQKSGFYGFPKGHMELSESEIETCIREVKEETNLLVQIKEDLRFPIQYQQEENLIKEVIYFVATPVTLDLKIQEKELLEAKWVPIEEVENILTFENLKKLWLEVYEKIKRL